MTLPTPQQLADSLPRVSAGIDAGDWTEPDDRLAWATKVLRMVRGCAPGSPVSDERGSDGTCTTPDTADGHTGAWSRSA